VEQGSSQQIMTSPRHPYTQGLLSCLPSHYENPSPGFRLPTIAGVVPHLGQRPTGCQLGPRCSYKRASCDQKPILLQSLAESDPGNWVQKVRCDYPLSGKEND